MLQSLIYELSPDVVHFQGALAATLGWTIPKGRAIWVYTAHNFPSVGASGWWRQDGIIAKKMDAVIAVSRSLADVLIQKGVSKEKITVIPNGIDLDRFVPQPLRYSPDAPVLLAMGRLVPEKGFAYLLEAMRLVCKVHKMDMRLILAGDGTDRGRLEKLARKLDISDSVVFTGHVSSPEKLFKEAFALVTPSTLEGLGLVNIEAMAMGRPVISTWTGGIPEVVVNGETGLLVPPKTPEALATAMTLLLQNPLMAERLGLAGIKRAQRCFSASAMIGKTISVYQGAYKA